VADIPKTRFAQLGDDRIAYQVFGDAPVDLLYVPTSGECIDLRWDWPPYAAFLRRLAENARLVMFDRRGSGASDAPSGKTVPSWERWADDARAVLDAVGSERAVILGTNDAGPTSILFAATHPTRARGLILGNTSARFATAPDYPTGIPDINLAAQFVQEAWGTEVMAEMAAPSATGDPAFRRWYTVSQRLSLRPREARTLFQWEQTMDVRSALPSIRVPTLVIHRKNFAAITADHGRFLAEHIAGAKFALIAGSDGGLSSEPNDEVLQHIEEFLRGLRGGAEPDRALAAILFTDIVGSTERASVLGDQKWRNLLESHEVVARTVVEQHRGQLVKTTGDGMLATFDGPGRAIRCAIALDSALRPLGLEIRAGLHTGEVELLGHDIAGIGVHIAARVLEAAAPGEVLVSGAVPMLVAGSGIEFEDRGEHNLKGIPGAWRLFAVAG
jgi:class 3 adenylate cyclase